MVGAGDDLSGQPRNQSLGSVDGLDGVVDHFLLTDEGVLAPNYLSRNDDALREAFFHTLATVPSSGDMRSVLTGSVMGYAAGSEKVAYDVAGAFTNDGFKLRDGAWSGKFEAEKSKLIQVNLYAGNQYWFSLGTTAAAKKVAVSVYDENGKPLGFEPYADLGKAAAGFAPRVSGTYYVKVEELEGAPSSFCLLYSYK